MLQGVLFEFTLTILIQSFAWPCIFIANNIEVKTFTSNCCNKIIISTLLTTIQGVKYTSEKSGHES